jgi:cell division protein FtsI (penicillin-binding protein 3)
VVKVSSNVGATKIAFRLGREALHAQLLRFGFGTQTGIELPGERNGTVRDSKKWGDRGLASTSFGYGLTVTPLQIAAGVAAIARGGLYLAPHILKELRSPDGNVLSRPDRTPHRVLGEQASADMMKMLESVMEEGGTGDAIHVPGFRVAGKTGTAHKVDPVTHKYAKHYISSFVGVVPARAPRLIVLVMIDDPTGDNHYGGAVSGPVFERLAAESLRYLGVPSTEPIEPPRNAKKGAPAADAARPAAAPTPSNDDVPPIDSDLDADDDLPPAGPGEAIVVIPDFTGMSVAQAVSAARAAGVKIELEGSGRAVKQFPAAGRAMKSISCRITFDPG